MAPELYLHAVRTLRADRETLPEARQRLPAGLPPRAARRMTHLGTLMARVLAGRSIDSGTTLLYGTTYAEVRSLEDYVDSFPEPSPLLFQGSIHPSGIQQTFVHRKTPLGAFIPITGNDGMIASLLDNAFLVGGENIVVCGGEERGTWMLERGIACSRAFGWAFQLTRSPANAAGSLKIETAGGIIIPDEAVGHTHFFSSLDARSPLALPRPSGGLFRLEWK